jgi:hypothetical protein
MTAAEGEAAAMTAAERQAAAGMVAAGAVVVA